MMLATVSTLEHARPCSCWWFCNSAGAWSSRLAGLLKLGCSMLCGVFLFDIGIWNSDCDQLAFW